MKKILLALCILTGVCGLGQSISVIDYVKINNNKKKETLYFYEHNWKVYRDLAIEKGFIKSYRLLTTIPDSTANYDLMLITEFTDSAQYKLSEEHFQSIIKGLRPNGPLLLNELKPAGFRQNISSKTAMTFFESGGNGKKKE